MKSFGHFIKKKRLENRFSRPEVYRRGGFQFSSLCRLENDPSRHGINIKGLFQLAKAFKMKGWQLLKEFEESK